MTRPLDDVRILAVEQYGAGPWGSVHLADLGADVIKIEDPATSGDVGRVVPPFAEGGDSLFFETFNRNKRSISIDLANAAGRSVLHDLVARADAVYSNLRGDVPERLGLTYGSLSDVNPAIVCCSLSAFGMNGPRRAEPGYDYLLQGMAGWMSVAGEPDGPPTKTGLSMVDYSGGFVAALALMVGLHAARRDGVGMDCDVSLFDTAMALLTYPATGYLSTGAEPVRTRQSAHPSLVPFQNVRTGDGWMVLGCAKEKFFARLTVAIGRPELADDPRFGDFSARDRHADELIDLIEAELVTHPTEYWLDVLADAGVPCAPINTVAEAMRDPQLEPRQLIVETEHPRWGTVRQVASPVRVDGPRTDHQRAPRFNEHADDILGGLLEYEESKLAELAASGAFGSP